MSSEKSGARAVTDGNRHPNTGHPQGEPSSSWSNMGGQGGQPAQSQVDSVTRNPPVPPQPSKGRDR